MTAYRDFKYDDWVQNVSSKEKGRVISFNKEKDEVCVKYSDGSMSLGASHEFEFVSKIGKEMK